MTIHLTYGGSTIARTLSCPAWVSLSKEVPKAVGASTFADEGTLLHNAMESLYSADGADTPSGCLNMRYNDQELTQDLLDDKLIPAFEATEAVLDTYNIHKIQCEPFVQLIPDKAGGSIDMLCASEDGKTVVVIDYKFGYVTVPAVDNKQMLFYALSAMTDEVTADFFDRIEKLVCVIIQPNGNGEVADVWEVPEFDQVIDELEVSVDNAIAISESPQANAHTKTGDHCKYCPASATCPAKTGAAISALRLNPAKVEDLASALALIPQIESWIADVNKQAHEQLEIGVQIEGYKLVQKRASRVWAGDAEEVFKSRKFKKSELYETKPISPAKFEKLCKQKGVDFKKYAEYITSISSGTTIAPDGDKRPSVVPTKALKALADRL